MRLPRCQRLWYKSGITIQKEMPMRSPRRRPRMDQGNLFSPPLTIPIWQALPEEVRRELRRLLAEMLQSCQKNSNTPVHPTEVADE